MKPEIYKDEGYKLMGAAFEDCGWGMAEEIGFELELRGGAGEFPGNSSPRSAFSQRKLAFP